MTLAVDYEEGFRPVNSLISIQNNNFIKIFNFENNKIYDGELVFKLI